MAERESEAEAKREGRSSERHICCHRSPIWRDLDSCKRDRPAAAANPVSGHDVQAVIWVVIEVAFSFCLLN